MSGNAVIEVDRLNHFYGTGALRKQIPHHPVCADHRPARASHRRGAAVEQDRGRPVYGRGRAAVEHLGHRARDCLGKLAPDAGESTHGPRADSRWRRHRADGIGDAGWKRVTGAVNIEASLRTLSLFGELSDDLLQLVSAELQTRVLPPNTTIFQLGEAGGRGERHGAHWRAALFRSSAAAVRYAGGHQHRWLHCGLGCSRLGERPDA